MPVPTFDLMLRPILALALEGTVTRSSAPESMARHFDLSKDEQQARIPSGGSTVIRSRAGWAMTFLTKAALIERVAPKEYRATERGREFLRTHPDSISTYDLRTLEGWEQAWQPKGDPDEGAEEDDPDAPASVEARIEAKVRRAIPDEASRVDALRLLAFAIENATKSEVTRGF